MIKTVYPRDAVETTLTTGTKLIVGNYVTNHGDQAWGIIMTDTEGNVVSTAISDEAFRMFVEGVEFLRAQD